MKKYSHHPIKNRWGYLKWRTGNYVFHYFCILNLHFCYKVTYED